MSFANLSRDAFDGLGKLARDHGPTDLQAIIDELALRWAMWGKAAADGAAATATAEVPFHSVSTKTQQVLSVTFTPAATLTANDTDYATLTVRKRSALGADGGAVAEVTTKITGGTGDWVAFKPVTIPLVATEPTLADGESLTIAIAKAASGVIVPAGVLRASVK